MRLFCYKMVNDTGFAPNPFWGYLTLATCKPQMRASKIPGDWIAGFTSQGLCGDAVGDERLVYLMKVSEKRAVADYFNDARFQSKIPVMSTQVPVHRCGDNIYRPITPRPQSARDFEQLPNPNHWDGTISCSTTASQEHDLGGWYVLIAEQFVYFGREALYIPREIRPEVPKGQSAQGSRTHDDARAAAFIQYVLAEAGGANVQAPPHAWPVADQSWRHALEDRA